MVLSIGKYVAPLFVSYKHYVNEIAINFTPTGINYFFDENFSDIAKCPIQEIGDSEITEFSKVLFNTHKENRIESLESFLEQRFRKKNIQLVEQVIPIIECDKALKFKNICKELNVSERNINRLFHKYIGYSPKDYKKIICFRKAIKEKIKRLTKLFKIIAKLVLYQDSVHKTIRLLTL
ncbi:AraC family transcriptional regulator [Formosa agariphila]|uniref:AraC family transcriptional regulator n=1 Tax=Formosa agariphila TaxID=320324 RepID=UPI000AE1FA79|nr:AraC family transcriptional regulator [Formosa agariphila]